VSKIQATIVFQKNWDAIHERNPDGTRRYRYIINQGSSRSSKTFSLIDCFDLYARSERDKRLTVWRDTKTDCKKTVLNDVLKRLKSTFRYKLQQEFNKTESIFTYTTESTFEIHGTDDEEAVHGLTQDGAWFNEPYNISRETFDQIDQRTSDFIFIDLNPKKGHWVDDIMKDPRSIIIHSTFKDNPFCPEESRNKILSYQPVAACELVESGAIHETDAMVYDLVNNPSAYPPKLLNELIRCRENEAKRSANAFNWSVYGLGEKAERPNRIFSWDECSIEEYRAINVPVYVGVDWGKVDPWGIVECKYLDGTLYVHELNYESENEIRSHLTPTEQAQISGDEDGMVSWMFGKLGVGKSVPVIADNNRLLKIAALRRHGYTAFPASKPAGSVNDGIDLLHNLHVVFTSSSENIRYEQENYSWKVDNHGVTLDEPEDLNNHTIDPIRYVALYLQSRGIVRRM
jgi:phage terminase large subunit